MHIFLIGYMGAGKSSVASRLGRKLGLPHLDLDTYLEEKLQTSIPEMISNRVEQYFREEEHEALTEIVEMDDHVVATGGGTPCFFDNMETMNKSGLTVYLKLHPVSLFNRLENARVRRPLLRELSGVDLEQHIREQLKEREKFYQQAALVWKGESIDIELLSREITELTGMKSRR